MKSDPTTNILLGVIATGVAALTALAFERRYMACCASMDDADGDGPDDTLTRIRNKARETGREVRQEASSLRDRLEDGVDSLKEKASTLKDKVSDGLERAGSHLREGAEKLKDGLRQGVDEVKDGASAAASEAKKAADSASSKF